jgi:hypothetical protein
MGNRFNGKAKSRRKRQCLKACEGVQSRPVEDAADQHDDAQPGTSTGTPAHWRWQMLFGKKQGLLTKHLEVRLRLPFRVQLVGLQFVSFWWCDRERCGAVRVGAASEFFR